MNVVKAENVLACSKAFSEELYAQDLWAVFSTTAKAGRPEHIAMHKVWLKCRKPSIDELWASRYPTSGKYQASFVCLFSFVPAMIAVVPRDEEIIIEIEG